MEKIDTKEIKERLESWDCPKESGYGTVFYQLMDYIDHIESELSEQCRLNGMAQERELKLMAQVEDLKDINEMLRAKNESFELLLIENIELKAKVTKWQPIETAPKDGTEVFVYDAADKKIYRAKWYLDEEVQEWDAEDLEAGFYELNKCFGDYDDYFMALGNPTHWMPLPKAPEVK